MIEKQEDLQKKMKKRFNKLVKFTDSLLDTFDEMKKNMPPEVYAKCIPTVLMVCREILNQLKYVREQSQLLVNQKNLIYSPLQIMNHVNAELEKRTKKIVVLERKEEKKTKDEEETEDLSGF